MEIFSPDKALRDLPKTPVILKCILSGVDQQRAQTATDGPDGWSVLEVMCHLNDYEEIFAMRARRMVAEIVPNFPHADHLAWVTANHYAEQNLTATFATYLSRRRAFIAFLRGLTPEQWQRKGYTDVWGEVTVVQVAINATLHDVNHIEQIIRALGLSGDISTL